MRPPGRVAGHPVEASAESRSSPEWHSLLAKPLEASSFQVQESDHGRVNLDAGPCFRFLHVAPVCRQEEPPELCRTQTAFLAVVFMFLILQDSCSPILLFLPREPEASPGWRWTAT